MAYKTLMWSKQLLSAEVHWQTYLAILLTVVFWASAFAGIRVGLQAYTPESVALLRYLTASMILIIYALLTRMSLPRWRDVPGIALTGFIGFTFYNVALNAGEEQIPAGTASLIVASAPIFVAIFAGIFFREHLRGWAWLGMLISFGGVALISVEPGQGLQLSFSALLVLAAAIAQAAYSIAQKSYLQRYTALQYTTYAIWAGTIFLLVFTPGLFEQMPAASAGATLAVVYMGLFPGAIGYISWSYALSRLPAAKAGSFLYLIPAVAIFIAWVWLGEAPEVSAWLGGGLILVGVLVVNWRGKAKT
jgi:drug/metabolite transporter (DMT)-like permease